MSIKVRGEKWFRETASDWMANAGTHAIRHLTGYHDPDCEGKKREALMAYGRAKGFEEAADWLAAQREDD